LTFAEPISGYAIIAKLKEKPMKKKELRKLNLHRETIRSLEHPDLQYVHGGALSAVGMRCAANTDVARGCDSTVKVC
jgi:hypothetical protein